MSTNKTPLNAKCEILADLWLNYRDEVDFEEFIKYNDLGLPLAYAISSGIVLITDKAVSFIEETFDLLLAGLEIEDLGFETLDDVLDAK